MVYYFENVDRRWELVSMPAAPSGVAAIRDALSIEHPALPVIEGFTVALDTDWDAFAAVSAATPKKPFGKLTTDVGGTEDHVVTPSMTKRLYQAAREPKSLWLVPRADHGQYAAVASGEYERRLIQLFSAEGES